MTTIARNRPLSRGRRWTMAGLAFPSLLLMAAVNGYPVAFAAVQSVHDGGLLNLGNFIGFRNYLSVLSDPVFWSSARFTLIFTLCGVFGSWLLGFALALLLRPAFPGRNLFRVLLLLPWIVPIVVSAMGWNWLLATRNSLLPQIVEAMGLGRVMFLADPTFAVITVCVFKIWISYPFMMMMMGGALESVDGSVLEAGRVDGASKFDLLRYITLPMTARTTYICWILMAMFSVNDFTTIYLLTGGGPVNATNSLIVMSYRSVFQDFLPGYGVSIAFIITIALTSMSLILLRQIKKASAL